MKCPCCERGEMLPLLSGKQKASQCSRCSVVVPDGLETLHQPVPFWRRGYKRPISKQDAAVTPMTSYIRTKADKE